MTNEQLTKIAACFATLAFTIMTLGSWAMGARILVALVRGIEALALFGLLAFCVGKLLQRNVDFSLANPSHEEEDDEAKGAHLDETA